jgi:hypothetical protein
LPALPARHPAICERLLPIPRGESGQTGEVTRAQLDVVEKIVWRYVPAQAASLVAGAPVLSPHLLFVICCSS